MYSAEKIPKKFLKIKEDSVFEIQVVTKTYFMLLITGFEIQLGRVWDVFRRILYTIP